MRFVVSTLVAGLLLSGCGGSSGSGSSTPSPSPSPPPTTPANLTIQGDNTVTRGDSVGLLVRTDNGEPLNDITWTVAGGELQPLATHTQVIGFDAPEAGTYTVTVSASTQSGTQLTAETTLTVNEGTVPDAIVRLSHEVSEGGRASLRVDTSTDKQITAISWSQLSGPAAVKLRQDAGDTPHNIYFDAPYVNRDSVLRFRATLTFDDGSSASDSAYVLVRDIDYDISGYFYQDDDNDNIYSTVFSRMQPYHEDSPYASALKDCVYSNAITSTCSFNTLPLLGQQTESPTIDDVLDRTYVSHPWMGDAFREYLETSPASEDMLKLLRATTAVVISYDVRPSFYWSATGAIYLDANNFWRTPEERDTLNTTPDYRSDFGNELDFLTSWRYLKDGEYYYPQPGFSRAQRNSRDIGKVQAALTWLLYHELAHANDFFDYTVWGSLSGTDNPRSYYDRKTSQGGISSDKLDSALPLTSSQLHALGRVLYRGEDATQTQKNYTAQQVANWFAPDGAVTMYGYSTIREDFATVFERFMMLYRLGVSSDEGIFAQDDVDNGDGNPVITWGQRNRVNRDDIQLRADFVVSRVLPDIDVSAAQVTMPAPLLLPPGQRWGDLASYDGSVDGDAVIQGLSAYPARRAHISVPLQNPYVGTISMQEK